jgi:cytoskeletal protein CcmA (bactofilin family)
MKSSISRGWKVSKISGAIQIGSTGRVRGDISYGNLEIARGGEILGEMKKF